MLENVERFDDLRVKNVNTGADQMLRWQGHAAIMLQTVKFKCKTGDERKELFSLILFSLLGNTKVTNSNKTNHREWNLMSKNIFQI